ncbi:hypothetical protein XU18_1054 [Perkinsela sp. CCAP 1560/4]|nr:hypothetical protein XU18_1054 [Perkinsela sp. CCAP 1560/4]|eukprot:KNH08485.1 hypothetical protein XU18_1054 [Perkinsela sp. CCAP 1560/4]
MSKGFSPDIFEEDALRAILHTPSDDTFYTLEPNAPIWNISDDFSEFEASSLNMHRRESNIGSFQSGDITSTHLKNGSLEDVVNAKAIQLKNGQDNTSNLHHSNMPEDSVSMWETIERSLIEVDELREHFLLYRESNTVHFNSVNR